MAKTILVTGATGTVGSQVVRQLAGVPGVTVRSGVRDVSKPGVNPVKFVYDDAAVMTAACQGADAVFWVTPVTEDQVALAQPFLDAARAAGVKHLVKLSVMGVDAEPPMTISLWHRQMEAAMRASGMAWTSLRPSGFMQNFLTSSAPRPDGSIYAPLGNGAVAYIDVRDIAAVAVKALTDPGHEGKIYDLSGPEALTLAQMAEILAQVTGRPIRYVDVPESAARQGMSGAGLPEWMVSMILNIQEHARTGRSTQVYPTVEQITGQPARSFRAFAQDHAGHWKV